ncbi:MAG: hypothetical protein Q9218_006074, partial [Villophora microphyllina]
MPLHRLPPLRIDSTVTPAPTSAVRTPATATALSPTVSRSGSLLNPALSPSIWFPGPQPPARGRQSLSLNIDSTVAPAPAILTLASVTALAPAVCHAFMKTPILSPTFHQIGGNPLANGKANLGRISEMLSPVHASASNAIFDAEMDAMGGESGIDFFERHPFDNGARNPLAFLYERSAAVRGGTRPTE